MISRLRICTTRERLGIPLLFQLYSADTEIMAKRRAVNPLPSLREIKQSRVSLPAPPTGHPKFSNALKALMPVASKWKVIGAMLGVNHNTLECIREKNLNDPQDCLMEMVSEWNKLVDPVPSWQALVEAVELVDQSRAKMIREKYISNEADVIDSQGSKCDEKFPKMELPHGEFILPQTAASCGTPASPDSQVLPPHEEKTTSGALHSDSATDTDSDCRRLAMPPGAPGVSVLTTVASLGQSSDILDMVMDTSPCPQQTSAVDVPVDLQSASDTVEVHENPTVAYDRREMDGGSPEADGVNVEPHGLDKSPATICDAGGKCALTESLDTDAAQLYNLKMTPREYQTRLAEPGLRGESYIICLPTRTGKTLTASIVIADHLKQGALAAERRKVLFLVPTRQLASQQASRLKEYINGIKVIVVVGSYDSETETFIHPLLPEVDAVVSTPGKLRHELYSEKLKMSDFTLLILDECHHAVSPGSPYGDVMEFHLTEKITAAAQCAQVIGMTASPGAGKTKSPTFEKAVEHQLMLCARIDATSGFKTDYSKELQDYTGKPERISDLLEKRKSGDPFIEAVLDTMGKLEALLVGGISQYGHTDYRYKQWIEQQISAAQLRHEDQLDRLTVLEHLLEYHVAIITYEDFQFQDAMSIINNIKPIQEDKATPIGKYLDSLRMTLLSHLSSLRVDPNPVLSKVEQTLHTQFELNASSKGIFFVREIRHTQYVSKWINSSPRLNKLIKAERITGHTRAGMAQAEQNGVLEGFRSGEYNLLVSTSVLQEGIDIPECNFVIQFQYVPDEVAEVQARGRARAKDSTIYTILTTSSSLEGRKLIQKLKEEYSNRAVCHIANLDLSARIPNMQSSILEKRARRLEEAATHKKQWNPSEVEILCNSCKVKVCQGIDVYTYGHYPNFHYIAPHLEFEEEQKKMPDNSKTRYGAVKLYDIECKKCPNKTWGSLSRWNNGPTLPLLQCKAFTFRHGSETKTFKQWKLVPFHIQPYDDELCEQDGIIEPLDVATRSS